MEIFVFDACSIIAFFKKEPGFDKVKAILEKAQAGLCQIYMNKINVLEVYYGFYRDDSPAIAEKFYAYIFLLPIVVVDIISDQLFFEAGKLKALYRISLADSIALGEAKIRNASLVTSDHHEFDIIDKDKVVRFYWIR
ncbi:MAG: PIN domain-containing protein [Spirochaetota bacterium]